MKYDYVGGAKEYANIIKTHLSEELEYRNSYSSL